jgi:hypothetical protein
MGENTANCTYDKDWIPRIYKELGKLSNKKASNPVKKWSKILPRHFSKEDLQMANKYMTTSRERGANQTTLETTSYLLPSEPSDLEEEKPQMLVRMWRNLNPHTLLVGV